MTPRPAAGKPATSSPPVLVRIASQEPGRERHAECSIHRKEAMHALGAAYSLQPKQYSRANVAELRKQAESDSRSGGSYDYFAYLASPLPKSGNLQ